MRGIRPETLKKNVCRRVAELRTERGLTQAKMAEQLDVGLRYFQRVEEDGENLTIETVAKIANVLGVEPATLFTPPVSTKKPGRGRPRSKPKTDK